MDVDTVDGVDDEDGSRRDSRVNSRSDAASCHHRLGLLQAVLMSVATSFAHKELT